jgi:linoleoyl-CoA desaturase
VVGVDSDISQAPFARLATGQPWRRWHKYQHLYLSLVYGFLAMKWLTYGDFANLSHRRVGEQPLRRHPDVEIWPACWRASWPTSHGRS